MAYHYARINFKWPELQFLADCEMFTIRINLSSYATMAIGITNKNYVGQLLHQRHSFIFLPSATNFSWTICFSLSAIRILIPLSSGASLVTYIDLIPFKSVVGSTFAVARLIAQPEARIATTINRLIFKNVLRGTCSFPFQITTVPLKLREWSLTYGEFNP